MRKFKVEFKQNVENVENCFIKDFDNCNYTTNEVLSADEEHLVIGMIKDICQTSMVLRTALKRYESKDFKSFNLIVNNLKKGLVYDIEPTLESVQDNLAWFSAIEYLEVEIDYETLDLSISTLPISAMIMLFGKIRVLEWTCNLATLKEVFQKYTDYSFENFKVQKNY